MTTKEKDNLARQAEKYPRLDNLIKQSGWKDIEEILFDEYCDAIDIIKNPKTVKAEVEGRAVVKFIERFTDKVKSEIDFSKVAKEKYARKYLTKISEGD